MSLDNHQFTELRYKPDIVTYAVFSLYATWVISILFLASQAAPDIKSTGNCLTSLFAPLLSYIPDDFETPDFPNISYETASIPFTVQGRDFTLSVGETMESFQNKLDSLGLDISQSTSEAIWEFEDGIPVNLIELRLTIGSNRHCTYLFSVFFVESTDGQLYPVEVSTVADRVEIHFWRDVEAIIRGDTSGTFVHGGIMNLEPDELLPESIENDSIPKAQSILAYEI